MKHFIFDFETMSTNVNDGAVIDCSFLFFDTDKMLSNEPYTMKSISEVKTLKLSMKDQVSNFVSTIEEIVDKAMGDQCIIDSDLIGEDADQLDRYKNYIKAYLIRDYLISNNVIPSQLAY